MMVLCMNFSEEFLRLAVCMCIWKGLEFRIRDQAFPLRRALRRVA